MYLLATLQVVFTVTQNLGLNNRNQTVLLANGRITSQNISVLLQSNMRWGVLANVQNTTPLKVLKNVCFYTNKPYLSKSTSTLFEFLAAFGQIVQALSSSLANSSSKRNDSHVQFDSGYGALFDDHINEAFTFVGLLNNSKNKEL